MTTPQPIDATPPPTPLTILTLGRLSGDLSSLPRLFTRIRRARADAATRDERVLLIDLGGACASEVWHCGVTDGRSAWIALDGIGCDAALDDPPLSATAAAKLAALGESFRLTRVEAGAAHWRDDAGVWLTAGASAPDAAPCIDLRPAAATALDADGTLRLAQPPAGSIAITRVRWQGDHLALIVATVESSARDLPDPTVAGLVDFIFSEARYAQKRAAAEPPTSTASTDPPTEA